MENTVWYAKKGSDPDLISAAIIMARASGSIGATEAVCDGNQNVLRSATVAREGHQGKNYYKL